MSYSETVTSDMKIRTVCQQEQIAQLRQVATVLICQQKYDICSIGTLNLKRSS